jgi:ribosome-associated protein
VPATEEAVRLAVAAADAADDVKATDLALLDVSDLLVIVDVFLLASAGSDRQLKAIGERIEERLRDQGRRPLRREGTPSAGWVLLDFGDLVCHLFLTEQRGLYALERLWADVPRLDVRTGEVLGPATDLAVGAGAGHTLPGRGSATTAGPRSGSTPA